MLSECLCSVIFISLNNEQRTRVKKPTAEMQPREGKCSDLRRENLSYAEVAKIYRKLLSVSNCVYFMNQNFLYACKEKHINLGGAVLPVALDI